MLRFFRRKKLPVVQAPVEELHPVVPGDLSIRFEFAPEKAVQYKALLQQLRVDTAVFDGVMSDDDLLKVKYTVSSGMNPKAVLEAVEALRLCRVLLEDWDVERDVCIPELKYLIRLYSDLLEQLHAIEEQVS